jgi:hypothetical protein
VRTLDFASGMTTGINADGTYQLRINSQWHRSSAPDRAIQAEFFVDNSFLLTKCPKGMRYVPLPRKYQSPPISRLILTVPAGVSSCVHDIELTD